LPERIGGTIGLNGEGSVNILTGIRRVTHLITGIVNETLSGIGRTTLLPIVEIGRALSGGTDKIHRLGGGVIGEGGHHQHPKEKKEN
jgi:hypothetical protein